MTIQPFDTVLQFWFPDQLNQGQAATVRQWQWWFRGGISASENERFLPLLEQAARGELDSWTEEPRSRLALIILLDQFSRTIYQGTAQAYAQDSTARLLALEGVDIGHYSALETPWKKTFFLLPLGHSEGISHLDLAVQLADDLVQEASPGDRELLAFSAAQARAHREIVARFGRQPHRNAVLGRRSTPEELDYLAKGQLVHNRSMPPNLSKRSFDN